MTATEASSTYVLDLGRTAVMTERIPDICDIYWYASAGNTGRPVHPMCEAMSAASWIGLYVASKITSSGGISGNKSRTGTPAHVLTTPSAAVGASGPEAGVSLRDWCQKSSGTRFPEPSTPAELHPVDRLRRELDAAVEYHANYTSKIDKALGQPRSDDGDLLTNHLREIERLKALSEAASPPAESPSTVDSLRKFAEQLESGEPIKATRIERHDTPDGPMHVRTETELKPAESPDVVGEIRGLQYALEWIAAKRAGNPKLKAAAWEMLNDMQTAYEAAVARLQDGESINSTSQTDVPAESPDDWVMITDQWHRIRRVDECRKLDDDGVWTPCTASVGGTIEVWPELQFRCRRKDLPPVPVVPISVELGKLPPVDERKLPSIPREVLDDRSEWREQAAAWSEMFKWCCQNVFDCANNRYSGLTGLGTLAQWILDLKSAGKPLHPNATPPVVPKTRTVTLREYSLAGRKYWTTFSDVSSVTLTRRTCECEVPE